MQTPDIFHRKRKDPQAVGPGVLLTPPYPKMLPPNTSAHSPIVAGERVLDGSGHTVEIGHLNPVGHIPAGQRIVFCVVHIRVSFKQKISSGGKPVHLLRVPAFDVLRRVTPAQE